MPFVPTFDLYVCQNANALVSSRGIGFCIGVRLFGERVAVGVGYRWGETLPDIHIFSCDLGPYREIRPARAQAAQAGTRRFALPGGPALGAAAGPRTRRSAEGHPHGPGGKQIIGTGDTGRRDYLIVNRPEENAILVALKRPAAGRYTLSAAPGSVPIESVATAEGLEAPRVKAAVTKRGSKRVLRYRVDAAPGQTVTFAEQGKQTYRQLGRARGRRGRIVFSPADGLRGRRKIVALVQRGGVTRYSLDVARFSAPRPAKPGRPRRLRVRRKGSRLVVSWRRARAARQYGATLQISNGQRVFRLTRKRKLTITGINPRARGSVSVRALSSSGERGPAAKAKLRVRRR